MSVPKRITASLASLALSLLAGCFTCNALHSGLAFDSGPGSLGAPTDAKDAGAALAFVLCAPCILPVAEVAGAVALDVATFPIQVGFGFYPYGDRAEPGSPMRW